MAIINRKKIRQQSGGGKLQKKRKKKIKMEEDEEGRNELHHWISEIKMTRSMQFISYQIGGEKSKLGLKQNHGCKRGGKWWTISNRQFMWFSKMFWIGYGISLNRSSRVWLLCKCVELIRCKKYFSSLMWIVGSPLGIDRSGLHLVDVNYNLQSMPTFYRNWCSCVLREDIN